MEKWTVFEDVFLLKMGSHFIAIPDTQCMVYLPTFSIKINQMKVNRPYTECLGMLVYWRGPAVDCLGAEACDLAFYFCHWLTDLAGAEPYPQANGKRFENVAKTSCFVEETPREVGGI